MKKMKKILSLLLCAALVCGMLAGCAAPAENAVTESVSESTVESTVESQSTEEPESQPTEDITLFEGMEIRLGGMKGPTTMGMVKLLEDAEAGATVNDYDFTIAAAADELTPLLIQGKMDIAAVPVNLASVLYNKTEGALQMLAVNTLGVLYVVEKGGETVNSVADLKGKTIFATGKGTTPEYSLPTCWPSTA